MDGSGHIIRGKVAELAGSALLSGLFVSFAYAHWTAFQHQHRTSLVFAVATEALLAAVVFTRRPAKDVSFSVSAWITALGGTLMPLLLRPAGGGQDMAMGVAVQLLGTVLSIAGILSLNRSIGLLPAHRGIQRGGMYRFIRHPLYSAYSVTALGYLMNQLTLRNAVVVAAGFMFQLARLINEERLLSRDPEYLDYTRQTRWRLVPFVF